MIDSHTHLYCEDFDADRDAVVERARAAGVTHVVLPNENLDSIGRLNAMRDSYPGYVSAAMGLHPEDVDGGWRDALTRMRPLLDWGGYVAVGEIGIDLYWDATWRREQMQALAEQLGWCQELDLPFIIHCRNGLDECLEVIDGLGPGKPLRGVFHSFTGTEADVERIRRRGDFYFGVNGIVTFKKSTVPALLPAIGLDRLLLETDSPFLAPVPNRGRRNESANIPHICLAVAQALGIGEAEVSAATDANARALFGLQA